MDKSVEEEEEAEGEGEGEEDLDKTDPDGKRPRAQSIAPVLSAEQREDKGKKLMEELERKEEEEEKLARKKNKFKRFYCCRLLKFNRPWILIPFAVLTSSL